MARLQIDNLRFHGFGALGFEIETGECVAVSGPSGTGKTLLLRAIADLEEHDGSVLLDETDCRTIPAPAWRRRVGLLPAESAWWAERVADHFNDPEGESLGAGFEELGFTGEVRGWSISRLSTGERQRLALLRLLVNRPQVLLLDEPTANLDPGNTRRVERFIEDYRVRESAAVLWVTHDRGQALRVASRHLTMPDGRLSQAVPPADHAPEDATAAPGADFADGAILADDDAREDPS